MTDDSDTRALTLALARLEMQPGDLTLFDLDVLGSARLSLGVRAAVCYELRRALQGTQAPACGSRCRSRRPCAPPSRRKAAR